MKAAVLRCLTILPTSGNWSLSAAEPDVFLGSLFALAIAFGFAQAPALGWRPQNTLILPTHAPLFHLLCQLRPIEEIIALAAPFAGAIDIPKIMDGVFKVSCFRVHEYVYT
jgi:hypothetical protein